MKQIKTVVCLGCKKPFETFWAKYCSKECWDRLNLKITIDLFKEDKIKFNNELIDAICKGCGENFKLPRKAVGKSKKKKYCSHICMVNSGAYKRGKIGPTKNFPKSKVYFLKCSFCREFYSAKHRRDKILLCKSCKLWKNLRRYKNCRFCGNTFISSRNWNQYCSNECEKKWKANSKKVSKSKLNFKKRKRMERYLRRARKRKIPFEFFDPFEIFERDRWRCKICFIETPEKMRGKNEFNSPELDHLWPLSKGGHHTRLNSQCLCRDCNGKKNGQLPEIFIMTENGNEIIFQEEYR